MHSVEFMCMTISCLEVSLQFTLYFQLIPPARAHHFYSPRHFFFFLYFYYNCVPNNFLACLLLFSWRICTFSIGSYNYFIVLLFHRHSTFASVLTLSVLELCVPCTRFSFSPFLLHVFKREWVCVCVCVLSRWNVYVLHLKGHGRKFKSLKCTPHTPITINTHRQYPSNLRTFSLI